MAKKIGNWKETYKNEDEYRKIYSYNYYDENMDINYVADLKEWKDTNKVYLDIASYDIGYNKVNNILSSQEFGSFSQAKNYLKNFKPKGIPFIDDLVNEISKLI